MSNLLEKFEARFHGKDLKETNYHGITKQIKLRRAIPSNKASMIKFFWFYDLRLKVDLFDDFRAVKGVSEEGEPLLVLYKDWKSEGRISIPSYYLKNPDLLSAFSFQTQQTSGGATFTAFCSFVVFPLLPFTFSQVLKVQEPKEVIAHFTNLLFFLKSRCECYEGDQLVPYLHPQNLFFDWEGKMVGLEMLTQDHLSLALCRTIKLNKFFPGGFVNLKPGMEYSCYKEFIHSLIVLCKESGYDIPEIENLIHPRIRIKPSFNKEETEFILSDCIEYLTNQNADF